MEKARMTTFITEQPMMLDELLKSRDQHSTIGIWSSALGQGMFLCVVKEVCVDEDEQDTVIILKENDLLSQQIESHVIYLSEITGVYSFDEP